MDSYEIFETAKKLAKEKGENKDASSSIDLCSVGGGYSVYADEFKYNKNGLKIIYFEGFIDNGKELVNKITILNKYSFFASPMEVFFMIKKEGEEDNLRTFKSGNWEGKLESLAKN